MKRALVLLVSLLALTSLLVGGTSAAVAAPTATERLPAIEQALLVKLNAIRVARGLRPLVSSSGLQDAAAFHSRTMLQIGFFKHESNDGTPFFVRVKRFYGATGYGQWSVGENLLYSGAELDAQALIDVWLESPAHRRNMLSSAWREVGIGAVYSDAAGGTYGGAPTWMITMDFGFRIRTGSKSQTTLSVTRSTI